MSSLNYTVLVPYNNTEATGGDSLNYDLNVFYQVCRNILETSRMGPFADMDP